MLRFRNTLSGKVEEFRPMREGEARMYYCGPTVWDYGHIGNFRSAIAADILRRYLKFKGFKVTHVMNITDVEDRIIAKSQEAGLSIDDYTAKYIDALWEDFDALGCERPDSRPRATRHIPEMVALIEKLLQSNHAYESDGSVYYRIASFPEYGKLSKINFARQHRRPAAIASTPIAMTKRTRAILLSGKNLHPATEPAWDSAIGRGRPGWHYRMLGNVDEVSGRNLRHPRRRHRPGVSPSRERNCAERRSDWKRVCPLLDPLRASQSGRRDDVEVEGQLLHVSRRGCQRIFSGGAIRYFLLSVPYNKQINFTFDALDGAAKTAGWPA